SLRRRGADVRVMFHEPYFYFGWQHPFRNGLAVLQRMMASVLLRASGPAYISTASWVRYLRPLAPGDLKMIVTPIPSTVGRTPDTAAVARWRDRFGGAPIVGHFGTFGTHLAVE